MSRATENLNKRVVRGLSWNAANLLANKAVGILVRLVLTRLLVPEYFGFVAMVVVAIGLIKIFIDFGAQNALVQRVRDADSLLRYDSAFWFLLVSSIVWMIGFCVVGAPGLVAFYSEPKLATIAVVMSLSIPLHGISIIPLVRLTRRLQFKAIAISELVGVVGGAAVAVMLALFDAGVWSLVGQQLVSGCLTTALVYYFCPWRPRKRFSWSSLRDILNYSVYMLGSRIIHYMRTNMDYVLVGVLLSASSLGVYTLAFTLTETIRVSLSQIISRVMLPVYSKLQEQPSEIKKHYLFVTRSMSLLVFPVSLSTALYAEQIITFFFPDSWGGAVAPTRILSIAGMVYAVSGPASEVLQGIGKPGILFRIAAVNFVVVAAPSMWYLTRKYDLSGAALSVVIALLTMRFSTHIALKKLLGITELDVVRALVPTFLATGLSILTWSCFKDTVNFLLLLLTQFAIFGLVFLKVTGRRKSVPASRY